MHSFLPSKFDIITSAGADGNATANDTADTTAALDGDVVMANTNYSSTSTTGYTTKQDQTPVLDVEGLVAKLNCIPR